MRTLRLIGTTILMVMLAVTLQHVVMMKMKQ